MPRRRQATVVRIPGMGAAARARKRQFAATRGAFACHREHSHSRHGSAIAGQSPAPRSSKFDFGKPVLGRRDKAGAFVDLSERLARGAELQNSQSVQQRVEPALTPTPQPVRIPSDLKPVTENRSFAEGPALSVSRPSAPAPAAETPPTPARRAGRRQRFRFRFRIRCKSAGFGVSAAPRPPDPIADLIAADMNEAEERVLNAASSSRSQRVTSGADC